MDIDDILREVDPTENAIPDETRDLQMLTRAWIAERSAPELLEYVPSEFNHHFIEREFVLTNFLTFTDGQRTASLSESMRA